LTFKILIMKPIWKYLLISFFAALVIGYLVFSLRHFSGKERGKVCHDVKIILVDSTNVQLITQKDIDLIL